MGADLGERGQPRLEHILASPIDSHSGGEKLTVGGVLMRFENKEELFELKFAQEHLALAGLSLKKA
ncbi:hypothetical protein [Labrenzia sp. THAF82]|uniref:hypothetical protein n=1 Tax=Labrenzia sp. THAF82 TaxID=2587861 RepID=UPI001267EEAD|nr:hypothetical protein [Labrenzia sp. THAF82]